MYPTRFSLSAVQSWRRCQQQYYYRYVRGLRRRDKFPAPALGEVLHAYLARFYAGLKPYDAAPPNDAAAGLHRHALSSTAAEYDPVLRRYTRTAFEMGDEDKARGLSQVLPTAARIAERYFVAHGQHDAREQRVLEVEFTINVLPGSALLMHPIAITGIVDLITEERISGKTLLWEHKSTERVPEQHVRLTDLQTMLYAVILDRFRGTKIDAVRWNHLRTKEPTVPEQLKSGHLTRRADLDSTWEVYRARIAECGHSEADYADVKERLENRERSVYFPRHEQVIVARPDILLGDFAADCTAAMTARAAWERGDCRPVRAVARDCGWCDYYPLCEAAIVVGDEESIIPLHYEQKQIGGRHGEDSYGADGSAQAGG